MFVGHCTHEQLIEHYYEFTKNLKLDSSFLLHLGMDRPSVNNAFQPKLFDELHEKEGTSFLNVGTCCLDKVHNAYQTALKELKFDFNQFAVDIHSFFKVSSARREDYMRMDEVRFVLISTSYSSFSMNYHSCKRFLINSAFYNKYKITVNIWQLFNVSYWWKFFAIDPMCHKMYNKVQVIFILNFSFIMSYKMFLILFQKVLE